VGGMASHGIVPGTTMQRCATRELVFDLDASDYDKGATAVRTCGCSGQKGACYACWLYCELAAFVMDDALHVRMGIARERILWVWSGSRGFHVWVNHACVLQLTPGERESLCLRFFDFPEFTMPLDPSVARVFERVLLPAWRTRALSRADFCTRERVLTWIDWLRPPSATDEIEGSTGSRGAIQAPKWPPPCIDVGFSDALRAVLDEEDSPYQLPRTPQERWDAIERAWMTSRSAPRAPAYHALYWLMAQYAWPRLDSAVTYGKNKTLRAPFSVNPRSQRLALPCHPPCDPKHTEAHWNAVAHVALPELIAGQHGDVFDAALARFRAWLVYYEAASSPAVEPIVDAMDIDS
jgi:DNA primase small subunit